ALAARLDGRDSRVYVLLGDGEIEEGQVWEAVMAAHQFRLDNLVAIVDQNGYQQTGATAEQLRLRPLATKRDPPARPHRRARAPDTREHVACGKLSHPGQTTKGPPSTNTPRRIKG